jgi:hypothetical protein
MPATGSPYPPSSSGNLKQPQLPADVVAAATALSGAATSSGVAKAAAGKEVSSPTIGSIAALSPTAAFLEQLQQWKRQTPRWLPLAVAAQLGSLSSRASAAVEPAAGSIQAGKLHLQAALAAVMQREPGATACQQTAFAALGNSVRAKRAEVRRAKAAALLLLLRVQQRPQQCKQQQNCEPRGQQQEQQQRQWLAVQAYRIHPTPPQLAMPLHPCR